MLSRDFFGYRVLCTGFLFAGFLSTRFVFSAQRGYPGGHTFDRNFRIRDVDPCLTFLSPVRIGLT